MASLWLRPCLPALATVALFASVSGCVTAADVQRADNEDQLCWMRYRRMVRRDSDTVDGDVRTEDKRLTCLALDRKLDRLSKSYQEDNRQPVRDDRRGPSGGEIAAGVFQAFGSAMAGAAAASRASQSTSTTCNTTTVAGTLMTTCNSQ